jgi:hypothetical protein
MRTVTYQSVRDGIAVRMGIEPGQLLENTAQAIAEYVTSRVREAWDMDAWWPWVQGEARPYRPDYNGGTAYAQGAEVWYASTEAYYRATAATTGNVPTNGNFWALIEQIEPYFDLEDATRPVIGDLTGIYSADPLINRTAREYDYTLQGGRVYVLGTRWPRVPWIVYTRRAPHFAAAEWSVSTTYAAGRVVYLSSTGECYMALAATTGEDPDATPAKWSKQEMPYLLSEWVKAAAYADSLREDGQWEKAEVAERKAMRLLDQEFDKVQLKQNQRVRFAVVRD